MHILKDIPNEALTSELIRRLADEIKQLQEENQKLKEIVKRLNNEVNSYAGSGDCILELEARINKLLKLETKNKIMREALEFYADGNFEASHSINLGNSFVIAPSDDCDPDQIDGIRKWIAGKRAREALKQIDKLNK